MADDKKDLLIDPLAKLGSAFSNATQGFMKASSPLYAARSTLQSYNASLKSAREQFDSQQVELTRQRDAELSMLKEGSAEHSAVLNDYTSKLENLTETFEAKEKVLKKSVENQEKVVDKEKEINRQSFGVARGFERVSQGINSIQEGIKGLTFGLVDLTANTGKLSQFFKGFQDTATGIISIGAGLAEILGGAILFSGIMKKENEALKDVFGTVSETAKKFNPLNIFGALGDGFKNLFRDRSKEFDNTIGAFVGGLFDKKKVDKKGQVRDDKGKFAIGDASFVGAGQEMQQKLVAIKDTMFKGLVLYGDTVSKIGEGVSNVVDPKKLKKNVQKIGENLSSFKDGFVKALQPKNILGGIKKTGQNFTKGFKGTMGAVGKSFSKGVSGAFGAFKKPFAMIGTAAKTFLVGAGALLKTAVMFAAGALMGLGSMLIAMAPWILIGVAVVALGKLLYDIYKRHEEDIKPVFEYMGEIFKKIAEFIGPILSSIWDGVKMAFASLKDLFTFDPDESIFEGLMDIVLFPLNMAINFVKGLFGWGDPEKPFDLFQWISDTVASVWEWIKETFSWGNITDTVGGWFGFGGDDEVDGERAMGGPVAKGNSYLVGEKGPEIFTPSQNGKIIPNDDIRTAAMLKQGQDDVDSARQTAMNAVMSTSMVTQQNVSNSQTQISSKISTRNSDPSIGRTAALAT